MCMNENPKSDLT